MTLEPTPRLSFTAQHKCEATRKIDIYSGRRLHDKTMIISSLFILGCADRSLERYFVRLTPEHAEAANEFQDLASDFEINIFHRFDSFTQGFSANIPQYLVCNG